MKSKLAFSHVTLLDAISEVFEVWTNHVTPQTIFNCFCKAGFLLFNYTEDYVPLNQLRLNSVNDDMHNAEEHEDILNIWDKLQRNLICPENFLDYV